MTPLRKPSDVSFPDSILDPDSSSQNVDEGCEDARSNAGHTRNDFMHLQPFMESVGAVGNHPAEVQNLFYVGDHQRRHHTTKSNPFQYVELGTWRSLEEGNYVDAMDFHDDDFEIENISDLDPNDPDALQAFYSRTRPAVSTTSLAGPERIKLAKRGDGITRSRLLEGFDEVSPSGSSIHNPTRPIEASDHAPSCEIRKFGSDKNPAKEYQGSRKFHHCKVGSWTHDPQTENQTTHPDIPRRPALVGCTSIPSCDPFNSNSTHWIGRNPQIDGRNGDKATQTTEGDIREGSFPCDSPPIPREFLPTTLKLAAKRSERPPHPPQYHDAAALSDVDATTMEFANPFLNPHSMVNNEHRDLENVSPLALSREFGGIKEWINALPEGLITSSCLSFSDRSQDNVQLSLTAPERSNTRRAARIRDLEMSTPAGDKNPEHSYNPVSDFLGSYEPQSDAISSSELDNQLAELEFSRSTDEFLPLIKVEGVLIKILFQRAANEVFAGMDVEGLIDDQTSGNYTLQSHAGDREEYEFEWPNRFFLPHDLTPRRRRSDGTLSPCYCQGCATVYTWTWERGEMVHWPHDYDECCPCPFCTNYLDEHPFQELLSFEPEWDHPFDNSCSCVDCSLHSLKRRLLKLEEKRKRVENELRRDNFHWRRRSRRATV